MQYSNWLVCLIIFNIFVYVQYTCLRSAPTFFNFYKYSVLVCIDFGFILIQSLFNEIINS